jgi:hypothetical protein
MLVESPTIIQDVDELKLVPNSTLVIVLIMSRSDLDRASTELHVDENVVCDYRDASIRDERMCSEFAMQMLLFTIRWRTPIEIADAYGVSGIIRMNSDSGIS